MTLAEFRKQTAELPDEVILCVWEFGAAGYVPVGEVEWSGETLDLLPVQQNREER